MEHFITQIYSEMAGLYIHIPFCKQACFYCDFHFSTNQTLKPSLVQSIASEIALQKNYLTNESIDTIYLGGGTPSLLNEKELFLIFDSIHKHYRVLEKAEITLEANPEDINKAQIGMFRRVGINRLSIGIQSFHEPFLKWMNRNHTSDQSRQSVFMALEQGIENISIDLIYGIPSDTHVWWENDLKNVLALPIQHISAYNLTIESKTVFGRSLKKGFFSEASNEFSATQFDMVKDVLKSNDFIHYEISNFGKESYFSKHNSNYWKGVKYLGIGPSAHSFNIKERQHNQANNANYIKSIKNGTVPFEKEVLTEANRANEYLLTGLRTMWGIKLDNIAQYKSLDRDNFNKMVNRFLNSGDLINRNGNIVLSSKGIYFADRLISELFFEDPI